MRWILAAVLSFWCLIPFNAEAIPKSTQALTKHLESLGYTCTVDTKNKTELIKASHERYLNMMFSVTRVNIFKTHQKTHLIYV